MVARFFANAKKGDGDEAVDDFLESLDAPSGVNQPAAVSTAVEIQSNVTMSIADPIETQQPEAVCPSDEVQKDVTMNDADSACHHYSRRPFGCHGAGSRQRFKRRRCGRQP